jgi:hypothetical protein
MDKVIRIPMQLTQKDEYVSIPVRYTVERENEAVTIYSCKVDLPKDKIPEWLTPHEFSIRKVYKKPVTVTQLSHIKNWGSVDAALFADETAKHIRV